MHSCARICQALGDQFLPYMPIVLPPLIYAARADCDFVVMDSEECALVSFLCIFFSFYVRLFKNKFPINIITRVD